MNLRISGSHPQQFGIDGTDVLAFFNEVSLGPDLKVCGRSENGLLVINSSKLHDHGTFSAQVQS
jgi:hypothetical protein